MGKTSVNGSKLESPPEVVRLTSEQEDQLRALGYIE